MAGRYSTDALASSTSVVPSSRKKFGLDAKRFSIDSSYYEKPKVGHFIPTKSNTIGSGFGKTDDRYKAKNLRSIRPLEDSRVSMSPSMDKGNISVSINLADGGSNKFASNRFMSGSKRTMGIVRPHVHKGKGLSTNPSQPTMMTDK